MPPPFTSFEATGFPSEMLKEVSDFCFPFVIFVFITRVARNFCKFARVM